MSRVQAVLPTVLRTGAVLIAIAAVIDPSFMREQRVRPEVALVVTDASVPASMVSDVQDALKKDFVTIATNANGASGGAAATVLVGSSLPQDIRALAAPVFSVSPSRTRAGVRIAAVRHPSSLSLDAGAQIEVDVELDSVSVSPAPGDSIVVMLRDGPVLLDRVAAAVATAAASGTRGRHRTLGLSFTPVRAGFVPLQVQAMRGGAGADESRAARADLAVVVRDARSRVLFHDPRPSWMSTFVRRELERDPRVAVTSRVVTAPGISADAGRPPVELARLGPDSPFEVVVLGAPDALTANETTGLESFLRERGGSVVLLLDQPLSGAGERLTRSVGWTSRVEREDVALSAVPGSNAGSRADTAMLRVTEWTAPRSLPATATALLRRATPADRGTNVSAGSGDADPIVWRMPVGAGTLVVSGAMDAWRFRDSTQSSFGAFWRNTVAALAESAVPAVSVTARPAVVRPGEAVAVEVSVRDRWSVSDSSATLVLRGTLQRPATGSAKDVAQGSASDSVMGSGGARELLTSTPLRLWPGAVPGIASGTLRAPHAPGRYVVTVAAAGTGLDETRTATEFVVADSAVAPAPSDEASLQLWARTHRGVALRQAALPDLPGAMLAATGPSEPILPWHPMRSSLWIVPFAGLLAAEWWIRRRRGLA
ncbi:MAG: hypothetical protein V4617_07585 [Gemmatimonadota bacterium]